ncbi:Retrovirus-related Pol polyprotein from transposon RE1 [Vitis vinifera]|uniref:Retrovirus-related Pol polyprotein from transposon RE1 n=1 Tax=Vitis vinifera TaxID=29760 RepID=A0A438F9X5_VITVI|nr:Retrovirus-related Pol polyprotein from transposon RE1 [Vitis vinifera]
MCEKPSTKQPEVIVYSRKNVNHWKKNPTLQQCLESNARSKLDSIIPTRSGSRRDGALEKKIRLGKVVNLLEGKSTIGCKWIFTVKYNPDSLLERYKAPLVAKGFTQTYGIDYSETFAPMAKLNRVEVVSNQRLGNIEIGLDQSLLEDPKLDIASLREHDRTKHVETDRHFTKEKLEVGAICLPFVPTTQQIADILTKGLLRPNFKFFVCKLGMKDIYAPT